MDGKCVFAVRVVVVMLSLPIRSSKYFIKRRRKASIDLFRNKRKGRHTNIM
jgi:hypothetical protein